MYTELDEVSYTTLRRKLLRDKGSQVQKDFLKQLKGTGKKFCAWLFSEVELKQKPGDEIELLPKRKLTEDEFKEPPPSVEKLLAKTWASLQPARACRTSFWGYVTCRHLQAGIIEPSYLAANGGRLPGGAERIDTALKKDADVKTIDRTVRTAIRRLSGLRERGNRSVYTDCPLAMGWWRVRWTQEVNRSLDAKGDKDKRKAVERLLRKSAVWAEIVNLVISRNSVLGDLSVRTALVLKLAENLSALPNPQDLKISRRIGMRLAWQELAVLSVEELQLVFTEMFPELAVKPRPKSRWRFRRT